VDNSGRGASGQRNRVRVIANEKNVGFGAAANQGFRASAAPLVAVINDDARAEPDWLEALVSAAESREDAGMFASRIRLAADGRLDSAGMLLCRDGSSKQRGHLEPAEAYGRLQETLFASGCAAMYRREMLEEIGMFDESFFLYCEDTDLGLRARWAGWECLYVPEAMVDHLYSHSAGKASELKAYYVERNRLFLVVKNFPLRDLLLAPLYSIARYFWHLAYAASGRGKAAEFRSEGQSTARLAWCVARAHLALAGHWPALWRERRRMKRRMTAKQFHRLTKRFAISVRRMAAL
jgi:GT2 family glycosyltransferase